MIMSLTGMLFDCTPGLGSASVFMLRDSVAVGDYSIDVAMADVDGDGKEESGIMHTGPDGSLLFTISRFTGGTVGLADRTVTQLPGPRVNSGVRILRGCLDSDPNDEFSRGLWAEDQMLRLMSFDVDSTTLLPVLRGTIADIGMPMLLEARLDLMCSRRLRPGRVGRGVLAKVNAATQTWKPTPGQETFVHTLCLCVRLRPVAMQFSRGGSAVIDVERSRRMDGINTNPQ